LDSAVVWAPEGLTDGEIDALLSIRRLTSGLPGFRPVRVAAEAVGAVESVAPELADRAGRWHSVTPFAPYRHQAGKATDVFLHEELARELATRGMPTVRTLHIIKGDWLGFRRQRPGTAAELRALGLEVELSEPVRGPLVLGALSHFGLGVFEPLP
jgi:CRISPR-associated protein Csb2